MKFILPLSIFVTVLTAAALPVVKFPVDDKASAQVPVPSNLSIPTHTPTVEAILPDSIPGVLHENERGNHTCTRRIDCGSGVCWDDRDKPNNINADNDSGDVAKRDGFWGIGDDDKIFREMMDDIHHRAKAKPSTAKREPQSDEDSEDSVPTFCNIPGECTAYGPVLPPEKRDTNKDVNCHNNEQCSPGICQDGICLLK